MDLNELKSLINTQTIEIRLCKNAVNGEATLEQITEIGFITYDGKEYLVLFYDPVTTNFNLN